MTDGKNDGNKLFEFEKARYQVTDKSRPESEDYICKLVNLTLFNFNGTVKYYNGTCQRTIYPYTKEEVGRDISKEVGLFKQQIYDLNKEIEELKSKKYLPDAFEGNPEGLPIDDVLVRFWEAIFK